MKLRVGIKIFIDSTMVGSEELEIEEAEITKTVEALAKKHAKAIVARKHMIEFEFLDEPDVEQRFLRVGTDPAGMVKPVAIDLTTWRRPQ